MGDESQKQYWKSLSEREAPADAGDEFAEPLEGVTGELSRRGFLRAAGFTTAAATMAGCSRIPVQKAIPYLVKPEEITPGRSYFYASTCGACSAGCGILAKWRDGRPIKLEGSPEHPISRGGLCATGQASLLGLYDSQRLKGPLARGKPASWEEVDRAVLAALGPARQGAAVRVLTGTVTSPTLRAALDKFLRQFPNARRVAYDALSASAVLDAHEQTHGVRVFPRFRFDRAEVIAGFDADFLGTWVAPVEYAAGYRAERAPDAQPPRFSYHAQFEALLTLTGAKADRRFPVAPGEIGLALTHLAARVATLAGARFETAGLEDPLVPAADLDDLAKRLWEARGRSLVLCGAQHPAAQSLANFLNHLLGNYGSTIDIEQPSLQREGSDRDLETLRQDLAAGRAAALFILGANPVYDLPGGADLARQLQRVPLVVSLAQRMDETAELAHYVCPDHHFLESWGDAEAASGVVSLLQPMVPPLANTRAALETLAAWSGNPKAADALLREHWEAEIFPHRKSGPGAPKLSFQEFWDRSVERGYAEIERKRIEPKPFRMAAVQPVLRAARPAPGGLELALYPKVGLLDGRHAYNPWLQELPDPVSKVAWDNYASVSPALAARMGIADGDVMRIETNSAALELPAFVQPGQHDRVVGVALGYGSRLSRRFAKVGPQWLWGRPSVGSDGLVGANAAPLLALNGGLLCYTRSDARLAKTGAKRALASTQIHNTVSPPKNLTLPGTPPRPIVRETLFPILQQRVAAPPAPEKRREGEDLWPPDHPEAGHRWGMAIDLEACTGCSACVIACQAENNIPVVGRDEVMRRREMHWLRIDRYYSGDAGAPDVAFQPMLCQQCDYAPCETVCPVLATVHSDEGLNQQIYNRCVGTRYCENNCPYKVRRFNWFEYARDDRLQNLALNPDVAVRSRGVMEKCTFCVQRIQEAKIEARSRGETVQDGAIQTACQQSCPAQAIVFGDLNDPNGRVSRLTQGRRSYRVLEEFNLRPAIHYLAVVRNRPAGKGEQENG